MDIGKSFSYVFEDEKWISKVLVGGLFVLASFILVGIPFLMGYMLQTMRNVMQGLERPLPEWDNLGEKFKEGLILIIIVIIWTIPIWVLQGIAAIAGVGLVGMSGNSDLAGGAVGIFSICFSCLVSLYALAIAVLWPALYIRFARAPEFKTGFEFAEIWQFTKDNIGNIIIALLLMIVAGIISSFGAILCGVGILFTYFWYFLVYAHLLGQVWLRRKGDGGEWSQPAVV